MTRTASSTPSCLELIFGLKRGASIVFMEILLSDGKWTLTGAVLVYNVLLVLLII